MAKRTDYNDIIEKGRSANLGEIKFQNIIHAGLAFSGMLRILKKKQKIILHEKLLGVMKLLNDTQDIESFEKIHSEFCKWGTESIWLAEKTGKYLKPERLISYGQIAKTLNVVLKVAIHYAQLPDVQKAKSIRPWLHAAVDNAMMKMLKRTYKQDMESPWPESIEQVCRDQYLQIQAFVQNFIVQNHSQKPINAIDFDDIYWNLLNKKNSDNFAENDEGANHGQETD